MLAWDNKVHIVMVLDEQSSLVSKYQFDIHSTVKHSSYSSQKLSNIATADYGVLECLAVIHMMIWPH